MKKIAIVYVSVHHKNTKKIVDTVATVINADVFSVSEAKNVEFSNYDFIGVASGIYFGNVHKSIYNFLDSTKSLPQNVFAILTSGTASKKYERVFWSKISNLGLNCKGIFHCKGYDTNGVLKFIGGIAKGRPNKNDLEKARIFSMKLMD